MAKADELDELTGDELRSLLAAAQSGDAAAKDALLRRYQPFLQRRARRLGSARLRGSDLAQDTAERALRTLASFRGTTEPELRAWLGTILSHVVSQRLRDEHRLKRRGTLVPLSDAAPSTAPEPSPSQVLRGKEAWRALARAVAMLPASQREVVRRHLRGASVAELAAELKKTPASISCLLQRGGQAVRAQLGEAHGDQSLGAWFTAMQALLAEEG